MTASNWSVRALVVGAMLAGAARAEAQPRQPNPRPPIVVQPQITGATPIPASLFNRPAFNPGPFYNPALNNPWLNQTNVIPVGFNNPFAQNPFNNPFPPNQFVGPVWPGGAFGWSGFGCVPPGRLFFKNFDLQVNPTAGLVYRPISGVARTADGSTFFRVPGTGLPNASGQYTAGSGLYFDPAHGTFLNPGTGVISRPGVTNIFAPWRP
jgi:hypothetical protein